MSCEPPAHIEALLHQLMLLFAEVQPVDSEQVIAAARRSLSIPDKLQVSWDDIRHAIINGLVVGGTSSPPPEVTGLLSGFLRRLPLRRLVHSPRAGPLHGDSALVILWKKEVGIVAVLLTLNARSAICIGPEQVWLALSSIGTNNQCYCWPHGYLLTETPSPSSLKKELHVIGNKFKWAFERVTQYSYTIGDLTSTNQCWSCRMQT